MTDRRDRDRAAVYAAEDVVARLLDHTDEVPIVEIAGSHVALPVERHFADIESVQRYVDAVLGLAWVRARWPDAAGRAVTVRERRGMTKAHYEPTSATLAIPIAGQASRWARRELVVLHELAHHLGAPNDTIHDTAFVRRFVELVDGVIGAEAAFALRVALTDQGLVAS